MLEQLYWAESTEKVWLMLMESIYSNRVLRPYSQSLRLSGDRLGKESTFRRYAWEQVEQPVRPREWVDFRLRAKHWPTASADR